MDDPSIPSRAATTSPADLTVQQGDIIGKGIPFHGQPLLCPISADTGLDLAERLEVVRFIGTGTHASVYFVREVLSASINNDLDADAAGGPALPTYGREFAVKVLPKSSLTKGSEAKRQSALSKSLPAHRNIATVYQTYENSSAFVLVLEYVSGENKIQELSRGMQPDFSSLAPILSTLPSFVDGRTYVIISVFSQMCDAVAACHDAGVYLSDLKLEDFWVSYGTSTSTPDDAIEDTLVVKLKGFRHSTSDAVGHQEAGTAKHSLDGPRARIADVTALSNILISMLSGRASAKRSAEGRVCFPGVSPTISDFLEQRVFEPVENTQIIGARELGAWAQDLPVDVLLRQGMSISGPSPGDVLESMPGPFGHLPTILEDDDDLFGVSVLAGEQDFDDLPPLTSPFLSDIPVHPSAESTSSPAPGTPPQSDPSDGIIIRLDGPPPLRRPRTGMPSMRDAEDPQDAKPTSVLRRSRARPPGSRLKFTPRKSTMLAAGPHESDASLLRAQPAGPFRALISRATRAMQRKSRVDVANAPQDLASVAGSSERVTSTFGMGTEESAFSSVAADEGVETEALQVAPALFGNTSAASSAVSIMTRNSYKSKKNVYTPPPGRVFLR
ncbi:hypothetical protein BV25DRAFT_1142611 [Artomyces pyxidatus]|uniref:Uncharacterized protein n=1 Tax=Artomyces pyxidatus TaxID=48021 RepID=A0ACB8SSY4_9AGAM|nr:hypothetical protein BV25DRAFT_1142611 [Artomyces pyxidatus]